MGPEDSAIHPETTINVEANDDNSPLSRRVLTSPLIALGKPDRLLEKAGLVEPVKPSSQQPPAPADATLVAKKGKSKKRDPSVFPKAAHTPSSAMKPQRFPKPSGTKSEFSNTFPTLV